MSAIQSKNLFHTYKETQKEEHRLLSKVKKSPEFSSLHKEANSNLKKLGLRPVKIKLVNKTSSGFRGECALNEISISKNQPHGEKLAVLIFELTNASHSPEFQDAGKKLEEGKFKSGEKYVRHMEKIEYAGLLRYVKLMQKNNLHDGTWGWVKNSDKLLKGFNYYYNDLLSESHKDLYRKEWQKWHTSKVQALSEKFAKEKHQIDPKWINNTIWKHLEDLDS